ncbi:MAG TPA: hypothetical protein VK390_08165 [Propionibacteriaceae bacterium]|nr:hypothetical protein [Propionibacteriaceae bacterium]
MSLRSVRAAERGAVDLSALWLLAVDRPGPAASSNCSITRAATTTVAQLDLATTTVAQLDLAEGALLHLALPGLDRLLSSQLVAGAAAYPDSGIVTSGSYVINLRAASAMPSGDIP